jgi:hypothetical protein
MEMYESKRFDLRRSAIALVLIGVLMGLRPGDTPWYFDMPRFFNVAMQFNSTPSHFLGMTLPFTPAPYGLKGTHGVRYGPGAVWLDQLMLAVTSDPIKMTAGRSVIFALVTGLALLWLTRVLEVTPWLAVVTMLSPWMFYYTRQLWDNSLLLPLIAMVLAAYGDFLKRPRAWSLCLVYVCMGLACLIHLECLPFVLPLTAHLLIFQMTWVKRFFWPLLSTVAVMFLISMPWLHYFLTFHGTAVPQYASRWAGWVFPFLGAQHITGWNVGYFLDFNVRHIQPAVVRYAFLVARVVSLVGFLACWVGMLIALPAARAAISKRGKASAIEHLCLLGWGVFVFHIFFNGIEHISEHPHYYDGVWIIYVMFAWLALDAAPQWLGRRSLLGQLILPAYAGSLLVVTVIVAYEIIRNGGSRSDHFSAVLSNQLEVAREIAQYSDASPIELRVPYWRDRPDAPAVTLKMVPHSSGERPLRRIVVQFRDAFPDDARIVAKAYPMDTASQPTGQPFINSSAGDGP